MIIIKQYNKNTVPSATARFSVMQYSQCGLRWTFMVRAVVRLCSVVCVIWSVFGPYFSNVVHIWSMVCGPVCVLINPIFSDFSTPCSMIMHIVINFGQRVQLFAQTSHHEPNVSLPSSSHCCERRFLTVRSTNLFKICFKLYTIMYCCPQIITICRGQRAEVQQ